MIFKINFVSLVFFSSIQPPENTHGFDKADLKKEIGLKCECLPSCDEEVIFDYWMIPKVEQWIGHPGHE